MQDDFVCGSDYENCLDPTGKWIVNGEVVVGSQPGVSGGNYEDDAATDGTLYSVWNYSAERTGTNNTTQTVTVNVWKDGSISEYVDTMTNTQPTGTSNDMMLYLRKKIGYVKDGKNYGMCSSVLNKCQDLTFEGKNNNKTFVYDNEVIKQYLTRTMIQIKAKQDEVLAEYADDCISDVVSCLSQNNYNYSGLNSSTTAGFSDAAINACMAVIQTCKSATTPDNKASSVKEWLSQALNLTTKLTIGGKDINVTPIGWGTKGEQVVFKSTTPILTEDANFKKLSDYVVISASTQQITLAKSVVDTLEDAKITTAGFTKTCDTSTAVCTLTKKAD